MVERFKIDLQLNTENSIPLEAYNSMAACVDNISVGQRLRAFREERLIIQTKFALALGMSRERLASYEAGRISDETVLKLGPSIKARFGVNPFDGLEGRTT